MQIKPVGSQHSFNDIADTDGVQISLVKYFTDIKVDQATEKVWFGAGVTYAQLAKVLEENDLALKNMPSFPHINVVGSVVTGSHGGGARKQAIANYVTALEIVNSQGVARLIKKGVDHDFEEHLHVFGALGVITKMEMSVVPSYNILKCIYENMSWQPWIDDPRKIDQLDNLGDFVSLFTDF